MMCRQDPSNCGVGALLVTSKLHAHALARQARTAALSSAGSWLL